MLRKILPIWILSYAAVLMAILFLSSQLPETVASHFDITGHPNGWMSREGLSWFLGGLATFINLLNGGFAWKLESIPLNFLNVPYKEDWLVTKSNQLLMYSRLRTFLGVTSIYVNTLLLYCYVGIVRFHVNQENAFGRGFLIYLLMSTFGLLLFAFIHFRVPADQTKS